MSESEAAALDIDCNYNTGDPPNHGNPIGAASVLGSSKPPSIDCIQNNEQLKDNKKWRKTKGKKEDTWEVQKVVNHLAVKIEFKKETGNCDKKKTDSLPVLQNGNDELVLYEGVICHTCGKRFSTEAELNVHIINDHIATVKQQKAKVTKGVRLRVPHYCFACNGKTFGSKLSLHRHILQHVSMPEVRLTRLKEIIEERSDSPVDIPSGKPQVALKRVTASCHARSPLRFRLRFTSDQRGKDSFKLIKSVTEKEEKPDEETLAIRNESDGSIEIKKIIAIDCEKSSEVNSEETLSEVEVTNTKNELEEDKQEEEEISLVREDKDDEISAIDAEGISAMVEASSEQCSVPFEEESGAESPKSLGRGGDSLNQEIVTEDPEEGIMRQMKNGKGEMEKIQSSSPSVIQSSQESGQVPVEKNGLTPATIDSLEPEFIPIESLGKDTAAQIIEGGVNSSQEKLDALLETQILCEACGESILGDQTTLEDHCLCRGHFKCPICSVACASTDALAVHTKESHTSQEVVAQPAERKKKSSSLRSVRRKHLEQKEKDQNKDSHSDMSNSPKVQSPTVEGHHSSTPPSTSASSTKTSESSQSSNTRMSEVNQLPSRVSEKRQSPSLQHSNTSPPRTSQPSSSDYPPNVRTSQHPNAHMRPPNVRVSESMPPPLMRPPNARNQESQPARGNLPNVCMTEPMQPPPALYKMPTTSHGLNNSQLGSSVSTVSNTGYVRGIPASGYQSDPQATTASSHLAASAAASAAAAAAAMNARYQPMHHGYPPVSQPPLGYPSYPQSVQMQQAQMMQQQRFSMGPPPPYPGQMHHLQQGPRVGVMPQDTYGITNSQQAYGQSLLKAHLEQARMQLSQPSTTLQSMQNLQQEHYQQQQLQQQLFQQPPHHQMVPQQQEQSQGPVPPPLQAGQKRKSSTGNSSGLRLHHQNALHNQQNLQNQLQQNAPAPAKQRRVNRDGIGIPSKQTDSDCEIIAVQQRGEGVPVIQSIQGANGPSASNAASPGSDLSNTTASTSSSNPESTIHLTDSITLSVRQPPGSSAAGTAGHRSHNASAVASILATRGITVTPASGTVPNPRTNSGQNRSRPSPPLNRGPATSPPQLPVQPPAMNSAISISHSSRQIASQAQHSNDGFAMPAPVGPSQRNIQRQQPTADRPPRPPTVDLTDETAAQAHAAATICQCRLCDKQFPSMETLQNHMQLIHQTRNYFKCSICNTKHPSQQALANHVKRVHKFSGSGPPSELVIPLVDLKNSALVNRLTNLGIRHFISLSQLGMNADNGSFCIPIMSLDSSGPQRNNTISGLMSMGTTAVLPIGPVKSLPNVPPSSPTSPQSVPSSHSSAPPPLAPLRPQPPHQYVQPPHPMPPR